MVFGGRDMDGGGVKSYRGIFMLSFKRSASYPIFGENREKATRAASGPGRLMGSSWHCDMPGSGSGVDDGP